MTINSNRKTRKSNQQRRLRSLHRKKKPKKLSIKDWISLSAEEINIVAKQQWQNKHILPCDECKSCCYSLKIHHEEIGKPAYQWCNKMTKQGCSIYPDRPKCCKSWFCFWALGMFGNDKSLRPDNSGIVVDIDANQIKIITVRPSEVGNIEASIVGQNLVSKMIDSKRKTKVSICYYNEKNEENEKIKLIPFEPTL